MVNRSTAHDRGPAPRFDWDTMREEWITRNMDPDNPWSYEQLSRAYGVSLSTVFLRAKQQQWKQLLNARRMGDKYAGVPSKDLILSSKEVFAEVDVRVRQASYARVAQNIAIQRLRTIDPQKLTVGQCIELLRLGLVEERHALGLSDEYHFVNPEDDDEDVTPDDLRRMVRDFIDLVKDDDGTYKQAEEAAPRRAVVRAGDSQVSAKSARRRGKARGKTARKARH